MKAPYKRFPDILMTQVCRCIPAFNYYSSLKKQNEIIVEHFLRMAVFEIVLVRNWQISMEETVNDKQRVDYQILNGTKQVVLIEAKHAGENWRPTFLSEVKNDIEKLNSALSGEYFSEYENKYGFIIFSYCAKHRIKVQNLVSKVGWTSSEMNTNSVDPRKDRWFLGKNEYMDFFVGDDFVGYECLVAKIFEDDTRQVGTR